MNQLKYPIGPFQPHSNPTYHEIVHFINQIPNITETLKVLIKNLEQQQLDTAYRPNGWTIRQIVHHIADNDMNA